MKSMATLIFEPLQRFANCIGIVRNLSHDSPSSADTATQSQNCQLDTKRFPGMRKVCERYAKSLATETSSWARGAQLTKPLVVIKIQ